MRRGSQLPVGCAALPAPATGVSVSSPIIHRQALYLKGFSLFVSELPGDRCPHLLACSCSNFILLCFNRRVDGFRFPKLGGMEWLAAAEGAELNAQLTERSTESSLTKPAGGQIISKCTVGELNVVRAVRLQTTREKNSSN